MANERAGEEMPDIEVPEGYTAIESSAPFGKHNGPIFERRDDGGFSRAIRVLERHCNQGGVAHGGMLVTLVDVILGTTVWRLTGKPSVTVRMVVDFLGPVRLGDWVEGGATITRETRSLIFVEGELRTRDRIVLSATGIFRPLTRSAP